MNIFVLDTDPTTCARYHTDAHVVKMVLEAAQVLSTVCHLAGGVAPYKPTHKAHPCVLWANHSRANWDWLCALGIALGAEYTHRWGRTHKSALVIDALVRPALPDLGLTPWAQAMPEALRGPCAVNAYRAYYRGPKAHLHRWTRREVPPWI